MPDITTGNTMAPCVHDRRAGGRSHSSGPQLGNPALWREFCIEHSGSLDDTAHPTVVYQRCEWREGCDGGIAEDVNPATGAVFAPRRPGRCGGTSRTPSPPPTPRACAWAEAAGRTEREALLLRHRRALIARRADEIRDLIIEETGSVMMKAPWEVGYAVECLRSAAACTRQPHGATFPPSAKGQVGMTVRQPLGVIAGIAPFNSPFLLSIKKVAFALAAATPSC